MNHAPFSAEWWAEMTREKLGFTEGDVCGRDGCTGVIKITEVENCYCHACRMPPCSQCMSVHPWCPECGWEDKGNHP
jgi:hypothetical protein